MSLDSILTKYRAVARDNRDLGDRFERLIERYLLTDPQYANRLSDVWLWSEWPDRPGADVGIDLVAQERDTGIYWAIQCKFYDRATTIQRQHIDSFFTASGQSFNVNGQENHFGHRLIVSTTDRWGPNAERAMRDQMIPVGRLTLHDLAQSPVDWSQLDDDGRGSLGVRESNTLKDHQRDAIAAAVDGFAASDRGRLIMACGTGKTFTSLKLAETLVPSGGSILFLAPSIALVAQTLREWTAQAESQFTAFVVCSDSSVGRGGEDLDTHEFAFPATTAPERLAEDADSAAKGRRTVVFSTYQSISVVGEAQSLGLPRFDLIVCDEAHRTTGVTLAGAEDSEFVKVHDDAIVGGERRLYMTATPRIFGEATRGRAAGGNASLFSMDDPEVFGPEFYRLTFGRAVSLGELSDYKVMIVAVDQESMARTANAYNNAYRLDENSAIGVDFATRIIGAWKGMSKLGLRVLDDEAGEVVDYDDAAAMRRVVAFSTTIKASKQVTGSFAKMSELYESEYGEAESDRLVRCELEHVDGKMNAQLRQSAIDWLLSSSAEGRCRVLSNARCLSEGVDVPALDGIIFFDTRNSTVDIVQSVGRVMRKAVGKKFGYIILPVCIPSSRIQDYNRYLSSDAQFKGIWKVIKALRAHDESLVDESEFRRKIEIVDGRSGDGNDTGDGADGLDAGENTELPLEIPAMPLGDLTEAIYAAIPKKLGDREYWNDLAKDVALVAQRTIVRIQTLHDDVPAARASIEAFHRGIQENLNPAVTIGETIEMLAQHMITRPIFEALFDTASFDGAGSVSGSIQTIVDVLDEHAIGSETSELTCFYVTVRERIGYAKSPKSRQDIVKSLYETFFEAAFPNLADRLGIVYTPVEAVDFIIYSVEWALSEHFGASLADEDVKILDPFTGTGTFPVRLLQSGLLDADTIRRKYRDDLHATEIVLLAYYIATINVESAYREATGETEPFTGLVLADTFQMTESEQADTETGFSAANNERAQRLRELPIRVVMSNPPYKSKENDANVARQTVKYPALDARIRDTYSAASSATQRTNAYDSYSRAIRWASDRVGERGVVAFITNGSFLTGANLDGLRKSLVKDFDHLYVLDLRGNQLTQGEASAREGGKIFGSGSKQPVAISILVRDSLVTSHPGTLRYHDIGDYLSREDKLAKLEEFGHIGLVPWRTIVPSVDGDWARQSDPRFAHLIPLDPDQVDDGSAFFVKKTPGMSTNRDPWVTGYSRDGVETNVARLLDTYEQSRVRYVTSLNTVSDRAAPSFNELIETDQTRIKWTRSLKARAKRGEVVDFDPNAVRPLMYRPFNRRWLYLSRALNESVGNAWALQPTPAHDNLVIATTGVADRKGFSALVTDSLPSLHLVDSSPCFPLYWYSKAGSGNDLFDDGKPDDDGWVRHSNIGAAILERCRTVTGDASVQAEDVFWYVYGVLHAPTYKAAFEFDLAKAKGLARIPVVSAFAAFRDAGRELGTLHLSYETVKPYPLVEEPAPALFPDDAHYRVRKMAFGRADGEEDRSVVRVNERVTLREIPPEAYRYRVGGRSPVEWIIKQYQVEIDPTSQIELDPNDWSGDERYIVDLLRKAVRVGTETTRIVETLPTLDLPS